MLAVVWAIKNFRPYLWGWRFVVRTDHSSLRWLQSFKDPEGQVARWLEILSEYDFTVLHRPGRKHSNADALSRMPCKQCGLQDSAVEATTSTTLKSPAQVFSTWIPVLPSADQKQEQQSDPDIQQVTKWLLHKTVPLQFPSHGSYWLQTLWSQSSHLLVNGGILYRKWEDVLGKGENRHLQLVLPKALVKPILQELHNAPSGSHLGITKTLDKVRSRFYWPGQRKNVEDWCRRCEMCVSHKSPCTKSRAPLQSDGTGIPLQRVAMDILGPLPLTNRGNKYVVVVADYFTKWVEAYPMPNMEAKTVAELFVSQFVCHFGVPEVLHTDQGRNFESNLLKVCKLLGVAKTRTTPYHPQSDGLVERFNRTLLSLLSMAAAENERD